MPVKTGGSPEVALNFGEPLAQPGAAGTCGDVGGKFELLGGSDGAWLGYSGILPDPEGEFRFEMLELLPCDPETGMTGGGGGAAACKDVRLGRGDEL